MFIDQNVKSTRVLYKQLYKGYDWLSYYPILSFFIDTINQYKPKYVIYDNNTKAVFNVLVQLNKPLTFRDLLFLVMQEKSKNRQSVNLPLLQQEQQQE